MMRPVLRLCEDVLSNGGAVELSALPRMIFVVHGSIAIGDRMLRDEETFGGEGAVLVKAGGPGGAWYETGPDGVFAQAAERPTRFVRVMILPRAYLGKSSVEYLNEDDKAKPKSQSYKIFVDMPLPRSNRGRTSG